MRERVPPGQKVTRKFPVLHAGVVPDYDPQEWSLRLFGMVPEERVFTLKEFLDLPRVKVRCDVHCVTTWSKLDTDWEGVDTNQIVREARPRPGATHVMVHCFGGFTTNLSLDDFLQDGVILATHFAGRELTPEHGLPHLYFWKSAKWVEGIEFTDRDRPGFWEQRGYHMRGDPWKEQRFS